MPYLFFADLLVVTHLAFVAFVILGGLLVRRWPWVAWFHIPAVCWGVGIELTSGTCPLTPLENWLRNRGGAMAYETDFVAEYLLPLVYPVGLTRTAQFAFGSGALAVNVLAYRRLWRRRSGAPCRIMRG